MRLIWLLSLLVATASWGINEDDLLPVEQAFALSVSASGSDRLQARWDVADGYYLYRERISFASQTPGIEIGDYDLPPGKAYEDEFFGHVQTYRGRIEASIPIVRSDPSIRTLALQVTSQGCADLGVCYPPHRQLVEVALPAAASAAPGSGFSFGATAGGLLGGDALPVDEAFRFETIALSGDELLARWTIAEGYYLYRAQIGFETGPDQPASIADFELPPGEDMVDEHFGAVKVYFDELEVPIQLHRHKADAGALALSATYQGCKEAGICYPPQERLLEVELPSWSGTLVQGNDSGRVTETMVPEQDRLAAALSDDAWWTLLTFFGFGLLLAFTPCVFPMIPILSGIIAGQGKDISTARAFWLSLVYVLAMALTYTVAGVIAGYWGYNLQAAFQNAWVLGAFSLVFVLLALAMFGFYELQLPAALQTRLNQISSRQNSGTWIGVAIMGLLSALIVGPCVAPPLAAALIYIGQTGDPVLGGAALFALSMGMGTPLIIIGTSAGRLLPRAGPWMDAVKAVFGVGLLALAIWMLERIIPPALVLLLWGTLAIASGVYLGAFDRIPDGASGWRRLWKALGVILVVLGALELIGAAAGGRDWTQPLRGVGLASGGPAATQAATFEKIKSVQDLEAKLAASDQPAMLDFYADWCVDCKRMDRYTFTDPAVIAAMARGLSLKADVTPNDEIDQALMRRLNIIGPPAILFFDRHGQEMGQFRVVGFMQAEAFADHLQRAYAEGSR